jgi:two-component system osmolarity sensor histidine kinase EnvZ
MYSCPTATIMRRPADSLFGRLALLFIGVLFVTHFAWFATIRFDRREMQSHFAIEEMIFLIDSVEQHLQREPDQPLPSRVRLVADDDPRLPSDNAKMPPSFRHFKEEMLNRLPAGTQIRIDMHLKPPALLVMSPGEHRWIMLPMQPMGPPRPYDRTLYWLIFIFVGAAFSALFAAWQLQRPLRRLAQAVARFGRGLPVDPVPANGPRELRQLTNGFNQMVRDISQAESDRGVMLAGVAHDLKTPLARLRLRAEMIEDDKSREGTVRDVDSLTHIVEQFLTFAHDSGDKSAVVEVDAQCERFAQNRPVASDSVAIELDLRAGDSFCLPAATLDRLLSNLVENAYAYGRPPVTIATARVDADWELSVSDRGNGIPQAELENATRPFVRLDPARGGSGHSGLGLAIVERLVRRAGGECSIENQVGGGLRVSLRFSRTPQPSPQSAAVSQPLARTDLAGQS